MGKAMLLQFFAKFLLKDNKNSTTWELSGIDKSMLWCDAGLDQLGIWHLFFKLIVAVLT